jgi:hypothetical protein
LIKGVVGKINHNEQYGLYSFFLKNQDGLYSLGEHPPTFQVGDSIQFDITQKGKYVYAKDIVPWTDGGGVESPQVGQREASRGDSKGRTFKPLYSGGKAGKSQEERDYWAKKDAVSEVTQRRIEIQAARNAAIETAKFLWEKELVAKPKKVADQYDAFLALVDQVASEYVKNTAERLGETSPSEASVAGEDDSRQVDGSGTTAEVWD